VRLIFEYEGSEVNLVSQQPVDVAVTGFDIARVSRPGHYVETRNAAGLPLSRVPLRESFATSTEVFPEDHADPITRVDLDAPRGAFTVVVPASEGATDVAVVRLTPRSPDASFIAAGATSPVPGDHEVVELAKFALNSGGSDGRSG
jgi:hypothetical protein